MRGGSGEGGRLRGIVRTSGPLEAGSGKRAVGRAPHPHIRPPRCRTRRRSARDSIGRQAESGKTSACRDVLLTFFEDLTGASRRRVLCHRQTGARAAVATHGGTHFVPTYTEIVS